MSDELSPGLRLPRMLFDRNRPAEERLALWRAHAESFADSAEGLHRHPGSLPHSHPGPRYHEHPEPRR